MPRLSQRAEERRGLFEHAADLTGLRLKAVEAERNLTEARNRRSHPPICCPRWNRVSNRWSGRRNRRASGKASTTGYQKLIERRSSGPNCWMSPDRLEHAESASQMESSRLSASQTAVDAALEQFEVPVEFAATRFRPSFLAKPRTCARSPKKPNSSPTSETWLPSVWLPSTVVAEI